MIQNYWVIVDAQSFWIIFKRLFLQEKELEKLFFHLLINTNRDFVIVGHCDEYNDEFGTMQFLISIEREENKK